MFFIWVISRAARLGARLFLLLPGHRELRLRDPKSTSPIYSLLAFPAVALVLMAQSANAASLSLESDSEIATAGFYQLSWKIPAQGDQIELHEAQDPALADSRVLYRGPDLARAVSGKSDGDYFYQVVSLSGKERDASNIVKVTVAHHPLRNAFLFFVIGALVFVAILAAILSGNRRGSDQ